MSDDKNLVSVPPIQVRIVDQNGVMNRAWSVWFRDLYKRVAYKGGNAIDNTIENVDDVNKRVDALSEDTQENSSNIQKNSNDISNVSQLLSSHVNNKNNPHSTTIDSLTDVDNTGKLDGYVLVYDDNLKKWLPRRAFRNSGVGSCSINSESGVISVWTDWVKLDFPSSEAGAKSGVVVGSDSSLMINYDDDSSSSGDAVFSFSVALSVQITAGFVPTLEIGVGFNDNEPVQVAASIRVTQPSATDYYPISFTNYGIASNGDKAHLWIRSSSGNIGFQVWNQTLGLKYEEKKKFNA